MVNQSYPTCLENLYKYQKKNSLKMTVDYYITQEFIDETKRIIKCNLNTNVTLRYNCYKTNNLTGPKYDKNTTQYCEDLYQENNKFNIKKCVDKFLTPGDKFMLNTI